MFNFGLEQDLLGAIDLIYIDDSVVVSSSTGMIMWACGPREALCRARKTSLKSIHGSLA